MKFSNLNRNLYRAFVSLIVLLSIPNTSFALNSVNQVVISGQVTNYEFGNPVDGHTIFIVSDSTQDGFSGYSKKVYTDSEGYYYDTIATNENKGSLIIYTLDYYGKMVDTTVYFRFLDRSNSMIIADFRLYLPIISEQLQARFKYVQKQSGNRAEYNFFDQTNNNHIISRYWEFGDGTTSAVQNPVHTYNSFGLFKVSLTIVAYSNGSIDTSTISKQFYISQTEFCHLGGHVFSEYFPIDMGYAYLYYLDSAKSYIPIDTMSFDTLGYYYFYQIPVGDYIVKAEPMVESDFYGILLPSYFGNTMFWEEAETISLTNTSWEYNIKLNYAEGFSIGSGGISGNIEYVGANRYSDGYSAKGVNIYLYDDYDNLLTCHYSDDFGDFAFDLIELNTYWIYPEVTGINSDKIKIMLTPDDPVVNDLEINLLSGNINSIDPENGITSPDLVGLPFPNPVSGILSIPIISDANTSISYNIYDTYGRFVTSNVVNAGIISGSFEIPISNLDNGSYIVQTKVDKQVYNRVFVVMK